MTAEPLRIGLVGPGSIAEHFLCPALQKISSQAVLWSVCGRDAEKTATFARKFEAKASKPALTSFEEQLADPMLDAVLIATPDKLHAAQCIAAAKAGKHVLVEKPMSTSEEEARAIVSAAKEADVRLAVAYHLRWHAGHRLVAERIRAGELGRIDHMRVAWTFRSDDASNWRASGDTGRWWALAATGTHAVDLVCWLLEPTCGAITEVRAMMSTHVFQARDEQTLFQMRFASGAIAEVLVGSLFRAPREWQVHGEKGSVRAVDTLGPWGKGSVWWSDEQVAFDPVDPYVGELTDFVSAVRSKRNAEVSGDEGLRNVLLLERITKAANLPGG